eukprot:TRINITY_DN17107_c0_g1_i1.p1 TRINITY_DN17107_c0_g1~~TRINITY_DN17107_c0_g1_i1.p1  ORF type:complete len:716 (+),score=145.26 TRINITY_DN17107_c0_g1_i1:201-2348(+)
MRKRDFGILLISVFSIFISLQHEGSFSFKEAWFFASDDGANPVLHEAERLPPPVVIDLNGDGRKEVLWVTHNANIQVIEPAAPRGEDPFRDAKKLAEVSMLPANVRVATGRHPVALAAGYLDVAPAMDRAVKAARKAVVVVVTAGWSVLCYDHNLKLLWENNLQEEFPHGARHKEVAILITNQTLQHGDRGVVIVGGSMEIQPQKFLDPFEEEMQAEDEEAAHRMAAKKGEALEDVSGGKAGLKERHFSYYAYDGGSGELRWKHESQDFHRDASALSERLLPQHNYKLDANALTSRHFGEVECREYRESVLGSMPHRWERRDDTWLELAHFRKHRRHTHKAQPKLKSHASVPPRGPSGKHQAGKDLTNPVARGLGKAIEMASSSNKKKRREAAHGNLTGHWWAPNAVVAHLKEGIEAVHLYSGRTICKLLLKAGGLHADINGDGVLDHVQASGARGGEQMVATGMDVPMQACWAVATSGVPVREQLFNGSICRASSLSHLQQPEFGSRAFGRMADLGEGSSPLEVATPVLLPRRDRHRHRKGSHGDTIFLTSHGDVSSYEAESLHAHHGRLRWQVSTEAQWENPPMPAGVPIERVIPTLAAIPLRRDGPIEVILAAGENTAVVLSPNGNKEASFTIPVAPVSPLIVVDFNNDGLNDIIAITQVGLYGFVQVRQPGIILFSSLLGLLVVGMSVLFVTQGVGRGANGARLHRKRSTD